MNKKLQLKIMSPLMGTAIALPSYASSGSAGMDLRACLTEPVTLAPNSQVTVPTGIALQILDPTLVGIVASRSGLANKFRVNVAQGGGGIIDSDYTGEILVILENRGDKPFIVEPGERIAQLLLMPVFQFDYNVVDSFDVETKRGAGGLGSTGVNNPALKGEACQIRSVLA